MIVYHGTGRYNLESLRITLPSVVRRLYLPRYRRAFSTTRDIEIAKLFAIRRSPPSVLHDESQCGVVFEYRLPPGNEKHWTFARDPGVIQDEQEVAVFKPEILELRAIWQRVDGDWIHEPEPARSRV